MVPRVHPQNKPRRGSSWQVTSVVVLREDPQDHARQSWDHNKTCVRYFWSSKLFGVLCSRAFRASRARTFSRPLSVASILAGSFCCDGPTWFFLSDERFLVSSSGELGEERAEFYLVGLFLSGVFQDMHALALATRSIPFSEKPRRLRL